MERLTGHSERWQVRQTARQPGPIASLLGAMALVVILVALFVLLLPVAIAIVLFLLLLGLVLRARIALANLRAPEDEHDADEYSADPGAHVQHKAPRRDREGRQNVRVINNR